MEFKGTKGVWKEINIQLADWSSCSVGVEKGKTICTLYYEGVDVTDEVKANAKLIAAAPEMFDELVKIMETYDKGTETYIRVMKLLTKITE